MSFDNLSLSTTVAEVITIIGNYKHFIYIPPHHFGTGKTLRIFDDSLYHLNFCDSRLKNLTQTVRRSLVDLVPHNKPLTESHLSPHQSLGTSFIKSCSIVSVQGLYAFRDVLLPYFNMAPVTSTFDS